MAEYKEVTTEVIDIAQELIREYHENIQECNIGFVFRDEAGTSGGKIVLAKCSKVPQNIKPVDELETMGVIGPKPDDGIEREVLIKEEA